MAGTQLTKLRSLARVADTRLEPVFRRMHEYWPAGEIYGNDSTRIFKFGNGAVVRQLNGSDGRLVDEATMLMKRRIGADEIESPEAMSELLKDPRNYMLAISKDGEVIGATLGFHNPENMSAQQVILAVHEEHEGKWFTEDNKYYSPHIGSLLSACRLTIAAEMAGGIEKLSYVTSELVPEEPMVVAGIYAPNAYAMKGVYALPPLSNDFKDDAAMVVLPHVLLMIPVHRDRPSSHVPLQEFESVVLGNQRALYNPAPEDVGGLRIDKSNIMVQEITLRFHDAMVSGKVPLVSLNNSEERKELLAKVEAWKANDMWAPTFVRIAMGAPLTEGKQD
jgi:hypothetical protein